MYEDFHRMFVSLDIKIKIKKKKKSNRNKILIPT